MTAAAPSTRKPKVYPSLYAGLAAMWRKNAPPPSPDAEEQRRKREERSAIEIAARRKRLAEENRVLPAGTLVSASIKMFRRHVLEVVSDPGHLTALTAASPSGDASRNAEPKFTKFAAIG